MLPQSIGTPNVDAIIHTVIQSYERCFPGRIRAGFLIGSYADGTAVALSDIDLVVVLDTLRDEAEKQTADEVARELAANSPIHLDVTLRAENDIATMYGVIRVGLKQGSVLVYGQDLRDRMTLPSMNEYTQDVIAGAMFFIARLNDIERIQALPLDYPDACDEFFGYTKKRFAEWYPPTTEAGTKELVAAVSRMATATLAQQGDQYVGSKGEAVRLYGELIGEPWGWFVTTVYQRCKTDWGYSIPETDFERLELAELCREMLGFENHFCRTVGISYVAQK